MNPSFFIPENQGVAPQGSLSTLSPINNYFGKQKSTRAQSPRVQYQRQTKKIINSLDFKRNSDYSLNVNGSQPEVVAKQTLFGDYKNPRSYAFQKL